MKHSDLGVLDDAVLLFGGSYSNACALQALLARAEEMRISCDNMICTGDLVAYCGEPGKTLALTIGLGIHVVAGNCEIQLAAEAIDCGCGFDAGSVCDLLSAGWFAYAASKVSADQRRWMAGLPDIVTFRHQGARYGVIHGGVTDVARFIWSTSTAEVFGAEWCAAEEQVGPLDNIICGHSGIPFIRQTSRGRWINAGVIGMPPHDGSQQTRFAVLDGGEVIIHRLQYDVTSAVASMKDAGLTQGYERALLTGYWPSEDILPAALRLPTLASG
ncbi:MAG: metallophosphoesterase family protein [Sulfitobacter sp.]